MVGFYFLVHQRFHLVGRFAAETHHPEIVADKRDGVMVVVEARKLVEKVAVIGVFDMRFEGEHPLGPSHLEYLVLDAQKLDIVVFLVFRTFGSGAEALADLADYAFGIADDHGTDRRADNDDHLERLPKDGKLSAHSHVTAKNAGEHCNDADDDEH